MAAHSNRRRVIIVDRKFQVRFALYMCVWIVGLCFVYPFIVQMLFDFFIRMMAHDPLGPDIETLERVRTQVLTLIMATEATFLVMTFLIASFLSHRIAGPLFKLRKSFADFASGQLDRPLKFRAKDHFQNVADDFNHMVNHLRDRSRHDAEMLAVTISRVSQASDKGSDDVRNELTPALAILKKLYDEQIALSAPAERQGHGEATESQATSTAATGSVPQGSGDGNTKTA